jgi:hypothetical protein
MKTVKFHSDAESEMNEAGEYYESCQKDLVKPGYWKSRV